MLELTPDELEAITDIKSAMRLALAGLEAANASHAKASNILDNALQVYKSSSTIRDAAQAQLKAATAINDKGETRAIQAIGVKKNEAIEAISELAKEHLKAFNANYSQKKNEAFYFLVGACGVGSAIGFIAALVMAFYKVGGFYGNP